MSAPGSAGAPGAPGADGEGRIVRLSQDDAVAAAEAIGVPSYMARLSLFQVLLKHPELARGFSALLGLLLFNGALDSRLRELIIMRLGWRSGSVYEWTQHWAVARGLGMSREDLVGVRDWEAHDGFGPAERAVLAATDETLDSGAISAATWGALVDRVGGGDEGERILLEVVAVIGAWRMVASWLRSLEVPLEDGVAPWPPDGTAPEPPR